MSEFKLDIKEEGDVVVITTEGTTVTMTKKK